jgi:hypothetical protein
MLETKSQDIQDIQEKQIFIVINPKSGSYTESYTKYMLDEINTIVPKDHFNLKILTTTHAGHATEFFRDDHIKLIALIVIIGGDGLVHEVVNGLFLNTHIICDTITGAKVYPMMAVCPNGSGNHLAKTVRTGSFEEFLDALKRFCAGTPLIRKIIPAKIEEIQTKHNEEKYCHESMHYELIQPKKSIISINTIVCGIPASINKTASNIAKYIPSVCSFMKYEIAAVSKISYREYVSLDVLSYADNEPGYVKNRKIFDVISLFVQTTPECGNGFVVDKRINGDERNLTYGYIKDTNSYSLSFEYLRERFGYKSDKFIRRYNYDSSIIILPSHKSNYNTINVDGQNENINLPARVSKYNSSFDFIGSDINNINNSNKERMERIVFLSDGPHVLD